MKKTIILGLLTLTIIFGNACAKSETTLTDISEIYVADRGENTEISVKVNGEKLILDQPPILRDDRTFVPIRAIAEKLGAEVLWDENSQNVTLSSEKGSVGFYIDYPVAYINKIETIIDAKPFIENERTMVPVRVIAQTLGANVVWDEKNNCVLISTSEKTSTSYEEYLADTSKPIVFDSAESRNDGVMRIPQFNLKNANEVNTKIANVLRSTIDFLSAIPYDAAKEEGLEMSYTYYVNNNIVSVITYFTESPGVIYYGFNFDITAGKELSLVDLCERLNLSTDEFFRIVREKRTKAFDTMFPASDWIGNYVSKDAYYAQREKAGGMKYISTDLQWFAGTGGNIYTLVPLPSLAGGDYMYAIDTEIALSDK